MSTFDTNLVNGGLGVMMFFVLSGFLITWLLLIEGDKNGKISLTKFYMRRTLRIFPAFYFFWFCGISIYILRGHHIVWPEALSAFFYLSNYYYGIPLGEADGSLFSHTWSLCVEEQFYLLWPLLGVAAGLAARLGARKPRRALTILAALVSILSLVWARTEREV